MKPLSGEAQWREKRFAAGIPSAMLIHTEDDSKSVKVGNQASFNSEKLHLRFE